MDSYILIAWVNSQNFLSKKFIIHRTRHKFKNTIYCSNVAESLFHSS